MEPFLVESAIDRNQNLARLLKHYVTLFIVSIIISVIGLSIFVYLTIELSECNGSIGYEVTITQTISYLLQLIFSLICLRILTTECSLAVIIVVMVFTILGKLTAITFTYLLKDRNWGECYLSRAQGILLLTDQFVEILIIGILFAFAFQLYRKLLDK